jgi:hypothetical protein
VQVAVMVEVVEAVEVVEVVENNNIGDQIP